MPVPYVFWGLMIAWLVLGIGGRVRPELGASWRGYAGDALVFVLLALLGWAAFGPALK